MWNLIGYKWGVPITLTSCQFPSNVVPISSNSSWSLKYFPTTLFVLFWCIYRISLSEEPFRFLLRISVDLLWSIFDLSLLWILSLAWDFALVWKTMTMNWFNNFQKSPPVFNRIIIFSTKSTYFQQTRQVTKSTCFNKVDMFFCICFL